LIGVVVVVRRVGRDPFCDELGDALAECLAAVLTGVLAGACRRPLVGLAAALLPWSRVSRGRLAVVHRLGKMCHDIVCWPIVVDGSVAGAPSEPIVEPDGHTLRKLLPADQASVVHGALLWSRPIRAAALLPRLRIARPIIAREERRWEPAGRQTHKHKC